MFLSQGQYAISEYHDTNEVYAKLNDLIRQPIRQDRRWRPAVVTVLVGVFYISSAKRNPANRNPLIELIVRGWQ